MYVGVGFDVALENKVMERKGRAFLTKKSALYKNKFAPF